MGVGCIVLRRQTSIRAVSLTLLLGVSVLSTLLDNTVQMNEQQGASQSSQDGASDGNKKNDNDEKNDDHKWAQISTPFEINYPLHELAYFPLQNIGSFSTICHATCIPSGEQKEIILSTGIIPSGDVRWVEFSVSSYISDSVENPRRLVSCASYSQITQTIKNELCEQGFRFLHVMFQFAQLPSSFTLSEDDPTFHNKLVKVWNELGSDFVNRMHYICVVKEYPEEDIQQAVAIKDTFIQKYGIPPSRRDALTKAAEVKAESEEHHDDATEQNKVSDAKKQGGIADDTQLPSQRHLQQPASAGDTSVGTEGTAERTQPEGDIGVKDDGVEQSSGTEQQDTAQRRIDVDLQQQLDAQRAAAAQLAASQQQRKKRTGVAVGVVFGLLLLLILGGVALYLFIRRRSVRSLGNPSDPLLDVGNIDTLQLFQMTVETTSFHSRNEDFAARYVNENGPII